jgi:hypothetical protein
MTLTRCRPGRGAEVGPHWLALAQGTVTVGRWRRTGGVHHRPRRLYLRCGDPDPLGADVDPGRGRDRSGHRRPRRGSRDACISADREEAARDGGRNRRAPSCDNAGRLGAGPDCPSGTRIAESRVTTVPAPRGGTVARSSPRTMWNEAGFVLCLPPLTTRLVSTSSTVDRLRGRTAVPIRRQCPRMEVAAPESG